MDGSGGLIVVGGGAAGCMAAIAAARAGCRIALVERNGKIGRKLCLTGKGRCNVTSDSTVDEVLRRIPRNGKFLYSAVTRFDSADTMEFFQTLGVPLKTERGSRVFPCSDRAADIVDALERELRRLRVPILPGRVTRLMVESGAVRGAVTQQGEVLPCGAAVLATGGLSYPATGSTGDGYALAAAVGHTVTETRPSLVPLESPDPCCARMQGLSLKNVTLRVKNKKGRVIFQDMGELLFTHFGLSGPLILSASAHMREFDRDSYTCVIDLKPALDEAKLDARLVRELTAGANRDMSNLMGALAPRLMGPVLLERAGIPGDRKARDVTREERRALACVLKGFEVPVSGARPIGEAIVTSGGIRVSEVDPGTMMSRLVPGLFFAGELLDVDGYTGGFNLQIAWSTGHAAGEGAAAYLRR